jgi:hypothetical protein
MALEFGTTADKLYDLKDSLADYDTALAQSESKL